MNFQEFKKKFEKVPVVHYSHMVNEEPMVSVCVQTYRHAPFIKDCLDGILMQQTDFPIEVLLGEDASIDGTREICIEYAQKYPDKIRLFLHHRENNISVVGQPTGRFNLLYNLYSANGKYIALCEGDDYWTDPQKLQKQVEILRSNLDVTCCVTNTKIIDAYGNTILSKKIVIPPNNIEGKYNLHHFFTSTHRYPTATVLFKNFNIGALVREFEFTEYLPADWLLWIYLHQRGSIYFLNEVTTAYRLQENSLTHLADPVLRWEEDFKIRCNLISILPREYHEYLKNHSGTFFQLSLAYRKRNQKWMFFYYQIRSFFAAPNVYIKRIYSIILNKNI